MTVVASQMQTGEKAGEKSASSMPSGEPQLAPPPELVLNQLVHLFKLLADDTRLRILTFLQQVDELNVGQFCSLLHQRQPSVSHHLALLRTAGLIEMRRDGKHNYYRLVPERLEQLITLYFGSSPGQPARICFEGFELRYSPNKPAGY